MSTDLFPDFFDDSPAVAVEESASLPASPPQPATVAERPRQDHGESFRLRVQVFVCSLHPSRRAEIARRPRFRNQPYLRRVDDFDRDDQLP